MDFDVAQRLRRREHAVVRMQVCVERNDTRADEQQEMRVGAHAKHVTQRARCRRKHRCARYGGKDGSDPVEA